MGRKTNKKIGELNSIFELISHRSKAVEMNILELSYAIMRSNAVAATRNSSGLRCAATRPDGRCIRGAGLKPKLGVETNPSKPFLALSNDAAGR